MVASTNNTCFIVNGGVAFEGYNNAESKKMRMILHNFILSFYN